MKFVGIVMPDKEFQNYWKFINKYMQECEQYLINYAKIQGIESWQMFTGMFGLPEAYFDTVKQGAEFLELTHPVTTELRFIQAVMKG